MSWKKNHIYCLYSGVDSYVEVVHFNQKNSITVYHAIAEEFYNERYEKYDKSRGTDSFRRSVFEEDQDRFVRKVQIMQKIKETERKPGG